MSGGCAGCGHDLVAPTRYCTNCGRPVDDAAATGTGPGGTSVRIPRVVVPAPDDPLPGAEDPPPAATPSVATAPEDEDAVPVGSIGPRYGTGPRFPLYADEVAGGGVPAGGGAGRWLPVAALALAVLLVAAVLTGIVLVGGDDTSTAGGTGTAEPGEDLSTHEPEGEVTEPVSLASLATPAASATGPAGTSLSGERVTYEVENVLDGDPATAWRVEGDGTGESLTFSFAEEVAITELGLVNGYAKVDAHDGEEVDWYERNRVVTEVRWTLDDGEVLEQDLARDREPQVADVPTTLTRTVRLDIVAVSGHDGADRTPISEVVLQGAPAADLVP